MLGLGDEDSEARRLSTRLTGFRDSDRRRCEGSRASEGIQSGKVCEGLDSFPEHVTRWPLASKLVISLPTDVVLPV